MFREEEAIAAPFEVQSLHFPAAGTRDIKTPMKVANLRPELVTDLFFVSVPWLPQFSRLCSIEL
jgi:hypothetical protein